MAVEQEKALTLNYIVEVVSSINITISKALDQFNFENETYKKTLTDFMSLKIEIDNGIHIKYSGWIVWTTKSHTTFSELSLRTSMNQIDTFKASVNSLNKNIIKLLEEEK